MTSSRNKLYGWLLFFSAIGYLWVFYNLLFTHADSGATLCLFKTITHLPCPSCGVTRTICSLIHPEESISKIVNPLGILVAAMMLIVPLWILIDLLINKKSFYNQYINIERFLQKPPVAISSILLITFVWIWNIVKGL